MLNKMFTKLTAIENTEEAAERHAERINRQWLVEIPVLMLVAFVAAPIMLVILNSSLPIMAAFSIVGAITFFKVI